MSLRTKLRRRNRSDKATRLGAYPALRDATHAQLVDLSRWVDEVNLEPGDLIQGLGSTSRWVYAAADPDRLVQIGDDLVPVGEVVGLRSANGDPAEPTTIITAEPMTLLAVHGPRLAAFTQLITSEPGHHLRAASVIPFPQTLPAAA